MCRRGKQPQMERQEGTPPIADAWPVCVGCSRQSIGSSSRNDRSGTPFARY